MARARGDRAGGDRAGIMSYMKVGLGLGLGVTELV